MTATDHFKQLYDEYSRYRWPAMPDHGRTYPAYLSSLRSTNGMTRAIRGFLLLQGWMCERIAVMGRYKDETKVITDCMGFQKQIGSKTWIPGTGTRGRADLSAKIAGNSLEIEIKNKYTHDRMRPEQEQYKRLTEASGGVYMVATSFDDFHAWYMSRYSRNEKYLLLWEVIADGRTAV